MPESFEATTHLPWRSEHKDNLSYIQYVKLLLSPASDDYSFFIKSHVSFHSLFLVEMHSQEVFKFLMQTAFESICPSLFVFSRYVQILVLALVGLQGGPYPSINMCLDKYSAALGLLYLICKVKSSIYFKTLTHFLSQNVLSRLKLMYMLS